MRGVRVLQRGTERIRTLSRDSRKLVVMTTKILRKNKLFLRGGNFFFSCWTRIRILASFYDLLSWSTLRDNPVRIITLGEQDRARYHPSRVPLVPSREHEPSFFAREENIREDRLRSMESSSSLLLCLGRINYAKRRSIVCVLNFASFVFFFFFLLYSFPLVCNIFLLHVSYGLKLHRKLGSKLEFNLR